MSEGAPTLEPEHLPPTNPFATLTRPAPPSTSTPSSTSTGRRAAEAEGEALRAALAETPGNLTAAARVLGVARSTLYRMMLRHGLSPDEP